MKNPDKETKKLIPQPQSFPLQVAEEEIIETPSSETEMSVAMEMAKLATQQQQQQQSSDYYETEMAVRSLTGQPIEPVQQAQQAAAAAAAANSRRSSSNFGDDNK